MTLQLTRPLAILDLETTGTDPQKDRIVEISVLKLFPGGESETRTRLVKPGIPIPRNASDVHNITDGDVEGAPSFASMANALLAFLDGCDLCGYNLKRFDLRLLCAEFQRCGKTFSLEGRAIIDPMEIFYQKEPRDLQAAVRTYLGREHEGAHSAEADVAATFEILEEMIRRYDLPSNPIELHESLVDKDVVDSDGFFRRVEGEIRFVKGKHRGSPLDLVAKRHPDYLEWMLGQASMFEDTKRVVREAMGVGYDG
jgi:DNA polymerase III subunit epsilon